MTMKQISRSHLKVRVGLVLLVVAGVLVMHALLVIAADIASPGHHPSHEDPASLHGAIGVCVFVVAGTCALALRGARRGRHRPRPPRVSGPSNRVAPSPSAGSAPRRFELCVMRS